MYVQISILIDLGTFLHWYHWFTLQKAVLKIPCQQQWPRIARNRIHVQNLGKISVRGNSREHWMLNANETSNHGIIGKMPMSRPFVNNHAEIALVSFVLGRIHLVKLHAYNLLIIVFEIHNVLFLIINNRVACQYWTTFRWYSKFSNGWKISVHSR